MAKKAKFMREAAEAYSAEHDIVKNPSKLDDKDLIAKMEKYFKKFAKDYSANNDDGDDPYTCEVKDGGCGNWIQDDDKYCWYCGADVSEDETGGFVAIEGLGIGEDDSEKEENEDVDEEAENDEDEDEKPKKAKKEKKVKKDEEDNDDEEENKKNDSEDEPEDPKDNGQDEDAVSLKERVDTIRRLSMRSGSDAWKVGQELSVINESNQYKEEKFKTFEEFINKTLDMGRATGYMYIKIFDTCTEEEAGLIPIHKLNFLVRIKDEKVRKKLLKAAMPRSEGGKGMDIGGLKESAKVEAEKNPAPKTGSTGRPTVSPLRKLVGQTFKSNWGDDDNEMIVVDAEAFGGAGVGIHVKKLKKGLKFEIVELDDEAEEEGEIEE